MEPTLILCCSAHVTHNDILKKGMARLRWGTTSNGGWELTRVCCALK